MINFQDKELTFFLHNMIHLYNNDLEYLSSADISQRNVFKKVFYNLWFIILI